MTELVSLNAHADPQLSAAPAFASSAPRHSVSNGYSPPADDLPEDDSVIRCFCGIGEDDGNTVLCEVCNTWQHILCYYPDGVVPETHVCVNCQPRPHDRVSALERQQASRVFASSGDRKVKKSTTKSSKKKVKDANLHALQANGWIGGAGELDAGSGSPRDQPPPAKRPKTNHRSNPSASNFATTHSRKRAGSTTMNGHSPTKSPRSNSPEGYTGDFFSPQFMQSDNGKYIQVTDNSYASIQVTNDLRHWLDDTEALQEISPTLTQRDIFHRWDQNIEALKELSPGVNPCRREDASIAINGQRPVYRWVAANSFAPKDSYIGELNGHIGRIEEYCHDPNNRWDELRHPEPYVFFHDRLPIYIDCREEGSVMRYVGRSCQPNVKLQIIIHGQDFHFCFISLRDIQAGEELTVPWHVRDKQLEVIRTLGDGGNVRPEDESHFASWFTNVLANFGGCACLRLGPMGNCNMARFDLRNKERLVAQPTKIAKSRKIKRLTAQVSPSSTGHATNSRAGSEAVLQADHDEEMVDSRSLSAKSRSQPSSRDITPMVADAGLGLGVALSDRERRKLLQQEKLFEKMEADEQQGGRKTKRHSAGSALNTPVPSASKQLGFPDTSNPSPTATHSSSTRPRANGSVAPQGVNGSADHRARPEMATNTTQTDNGGENPLRASPPRRRTTGSFVSCLLRRVQSESQRRKERSASVASSESQDKPSLFPSQSPSSLSELPSATVAASKVSATTTPAISTTSMPPPPLPVTVQPEAPSQPPPPPPPPPAAADGSPDVDMKDAPEEEAASTSIPIDDLTHRLHQQATNTEQPSQPPSDPPAPPPPSPAPPWPSDTLPISAKSPEDAKPGLHVTLPTVPTFSSAGSMQTPTTPSTAADDNAPPYQLTFGDTVTQSPPNVATVAQSAAPFDKIGTPLFSPSTSSAVQPSPMKKKMSLSDYLGRNKKMKKKSEAAQVPTHPYRDGESADAAPAESEEYKSDPLEPSSDERELKDVEMIDRASAEPAKLEDDAGKAKEADMETSVSSVASSTAPTTAPAPAVATPAITS